MRRREPIRVLVLEPSNLVRRIMTNRLAEQEGIQVVGQASDPRDALRKIFAQSPDVLVSELDLPGMDALGFFRDLSRRQPLPILLYTSVAQATASGRLVEAMRSGVTQVVDKPEASAAVERSILDLARAIQRAGFSRRSSLEPTPAPRPVPQHSQRQRRHAIQPPYEPEPPRSRPARPPRASHGARPSSPRSPAAGSSVDSLIGQARSLRGVGMVATAPRSASRTDPIIVVGSSTGGPQALMRFVASLPADAPGVVIAQHLMEGFSEALAVRLGQVAHRPSSEAKPGALVEPGTIWLAPATAHVRLLPAAEGFRLQVERGALVNGHRPSVDVLFNSAARVAGARAVGVILTGMGRDGADGLLAMRRAGSRTLGQDEVSSVVYGMPKAAFEIGAVEEQGDPATLARRACEIARRMHAHAR